MNEDNYIDFVCVGNKGAGSMAKDVSGDQEGEVVGSVATLVVKARRMNCIFVT